MVGKNYEEALSTLFNCCFIWGGHIGEYWMTTNQSWYSIPPWQVLDSWYWLRPWYNSRGECKKVLSTPLFNSTKNALSFYHWNVVWQQKCPKWYWTEQYIEHFCIHPLKNYYVCDDHQTWVVIKTELLNLNRMKILIDEHRCGPPKLFAHYYLLSYF